MCEHLWGVVVDQRDMFNKEVQRKPSIILCSEVISLGVLLSFNLSFLALLGGTIRLQEWICYLGIGGIGLLHPMTAIWLRLKVIGHPKCQIYASKRFYMIYDMCLIWQSLWYHISEPAKVIHAYIFKHT